MQSFMFTGSYEPLRVDRERAAMSRSCCSGAWIVDTGIGTLQTVAFVMREESIAAARSYQPVRRGSAVEHVESGCLFCRFAMPRTAAVEH